MEEKIIRYVNQDLAYKTEEQKEKEFKIKVPTIESFIGELEFALMFLNFRDTPMFFEETREHEFHLKTFDGAILNTQHLLDEKADLRFLNPNIYFKELNSNLIPNLSIKFFDFNTGGETKQRLFQVRKVQNEVLRNCKQMQGKKVFEFRQSELNNNEKWYSYGKYYQAYEQVFKDSQKCEMLYPATIQEKFFIPKIEAERYMTTKDYYSDLRSYYMAISVALTSYYEWFVYIKENENSIGVKVPIRPESSKEIFSLRNIADKSRKKAICNFVKEHIRLLPVKSYDEEYRTTLIKEHLRGQTKFNWRGLEVHVIPAQYDLNRIKTNKKFIQN